jgi:hypothetical protein
VCKKTDCSSYTALLFYRLSTKVNLSFDKNAWHDHYGNSEFLKARAISQIDSSFFDGVISVNQKTTTVGNKNYILKHYLFTYFPSKENGIESITILELAGKRIVSL